eukprot:5984154-Prymnesium_polylepis.1
MHCDVRVATAAIGATIRSCSVGARPSSTARGARATRCSVTARSAWARLAIGDCVPQPPFPKCVYTRGPVDAVSERQIRAQQASARLAAAEADANQVLSRLSPSTVPLPRSAGSACGAAAALGNAAIGSPLLSLSHGVGSHTGTRFHESSKLFIPHIPACEALKTDCMGILQDAIA